MESVSVSMSVSTPVSKSISRSVSTPLTTSVRNRTKKLTSEEKQNEIFNPNLEVDLDTEILYKSINIDVDLDDVPREKIFPPPLTKRLNIELEYLFVNRD